MYRRVCPHEKTFFAVNAFPIHVVLEFLPHMNVTACQCRCWRLATSHENGMLHTPASTYCSQFRLLQIPYCSQVVKSSCLFCLMPMLLRYAGLRLHIQRTPLFPPFSICNCGHSSVGEAAADDDLDDFLNSLTDDAGPATAGGVGGSINDEDLDKFLG